MLTHLCNLAFSRPMPAAFVSIALAVLADAAKLVCLAGILALFMFIAIAAAGA